MGNTFSTIQKTKGKITTPGDKMVIPKNTPKKPSHLSNAEIQKKNWNNPANTKIIYPTFLIIDFILNFKN